MCPHLQRTRILTFPLLRLVAKGAWPLVLILIFCGPGASQELTPFVIPAQIDPAPAIWIEDFVPITVDAQRLGADEHFYQNERVRIWGVNLSFGANFPTHADAPHVATRLAAAGVNSVRCHHMDTARWPRGIWNAKDGRTIEPEALDRLDYFVNELARRGIWVNINLHVGRAHSEYLDLPKTNSNYDKIAGIFTPALVEAQKQYAKDLLDHVNPYRQVRYADDPAIAFVEITNEDSCFMWNGDETLRTLPAFYEKILSEQFNRWLQERYDSTEALRAVWSKGATPLGPNLLENGNLAIGNSGTPQNWHLEQHAGCQATISRRSNSAQDGIRIQIGKADQTQWHLQLSQGGLALRQGHYYTVAFDASSNRERTISCSVGQAHEPWSNLGLSRRVELTEDQTHYTFGFVASADEDDARISFAFSGDEAPVNLANVELHPGGQIALAQAESLEAGNIALFQDNESNPRIVDRMMFLAETEKAYFDEMYRYIKKDLGCDALVTGTIVFGPLGLYAQSDMDFIDSHAYWQHPRFPGRPWDQGNWTIEQKPMTDYPEEATLFRIAAERLAGKPFTVSEYNHPAPMDAQAECVPMMASFAAAQDWDGIWFYTYSHSGDSWDRETLSSFFDIDTNPGKWGFMRAGTSIFREGGVTPLRSAQSVFLADAQNDLATLAQLHARYDRGMLTILRETKTITRDDMFEKIYVPSYARNATLTSSDDGATTTVTWSANSQAGTNRGLYHAVSHDTRVITGHTALFAQATEGNIRITSPELATLTVTPVDNQTLLVTACGRCENTGMQFSPDRRTVGRAWGQAPVRIETVTGQLTLPPGRWIGQALTPEGTAKQRAAVSVRANDSVLKLSPEHETMWYLLQRQTR